MEKSREGLVICFFTNPYFYFILPLQRLTETTLTFIKDLVFKERIGWLGLNKFLSYWLNQLNRKVLELERKGYDLAWARQILQGSGVTQDLHQLISLNGELETLKLLSRIFSPDEIQHGGRVDFVTGRMGIEVWTPINIKPQRRVSMFIESIADELKWCGKTFHQIVYSPRSTNPMVFYSDAKLPEGIVQQGAEILLDTYNFQEELACNIMKEIRTVSYTHLTLPTN